MGKKQSFEKSLETLERIVAELESGNLTLDATLERYERGVAAHRECIGILASAEKRIELLLKGPDGEFVTQPFEEPEEEEEEDEEEEA